MSASVKIVSAGETLPLSVGTFDFAGYEGNYETSYLGSLTSSEDYLIASDNNGRNSLSNSFTDGTALTLNSSVRSTVPEKFENYIQAKITLPPGNLRINYDYSLSVERAEASAGPVMITFTIGDVTNSFRVPAGSASKSDRGAFNFGFAKEQEVTITVRSYTHSFRDSSSSGTLKAEFTPAEVPPEPEPEPEPPTPPEEEIGEIWTITSPMGSKVYLDDVFKGIITTGGLLIPNLPPGSYVIKFTLEGYTDYLIDVTVKALEQTQVSRTLVPIPEPEPVPPPELTWWEKFLDFIEQPLEALTALWSPSITIPAIKVLQDLVVSVAEREQFELPDWLWETGLAFFLIDLTDMMDETVITGTVPITPAGSLLTLTKAKSFLKAVDVLKKNPLKYTKLFRTLNYNTQRQILRALKKDDAANLARDIFGKSFDATLIKNAPFWNKLALIFKPTKGTVIREVYKWALLIWGVDTLVDWGAIDNFGFITAIPARKIEEMFQAGEITKEEAIEKLDKILKINDLGIAKIQSSKLFNPFALIFGEIFTAIAKGNKDNVTDVKNRILEAEPPKPKGTLIIRPDPTDSKVSVEGQIPSTGIFNQELDVGTYSFTVSKFGFISQTGSAVIEEGLTTETDIKLEEEVEPPTPPEEQKGNLIISVTPEDALIEVSGQPEITAPGTYELFQGFYTLKVSKEGFETQITTSYVRAQEDTRASFVLTEIITPPEISIIRIESDPIGATIFIDGETTFNITNTSLQVEPGSHTLTLKKREFIDEKIEFEIKEGESLLFNLTLVAIPVPPAPVPATITITSEPTDADIYIDGTYTFTKTPYTVILDAGSYIIRVQKEGYIPVEITAEIAEGEVDEIPFTLEIIPPDAPPQPPYIPYDPVYPSGYETLYPESIAPVFYETPAPSVEKELLVNIETTDSKPWKGRIYSIAFQDLSIPGIEPVVLVNDNEEELLRQFLDIFNQINPSKLLGFKLTFDHRYIFNKIMNYRMQSDKWANIQQKDVKQLMDQVQEEFVYFPDKSGTLDAYGKSLLGKGKYGAQAEILRRFLAKDFDYVKAFQERQIEITNGLYQLFRYCSSESFIQPISSSPEEIPQYNIEMSPASPVQTGQKQCVSCKAFNPIENKECFICHQALGT